MINQFNTEVQKQEKSENLSNECAIMTLTPTKEIFIKLKDVSEDMLATTESDLNKFLDDECLASHTVPVCVPLFTSPGSLYNFIKDNSSLLFDLMLTAWPFPLDSWGFTNKNIELINKYVVIKYYPVVCKAIATPTNSTLDLAVTFATPTSDFTDYILESIDSKKMVLSEEELNQMEFIISTGIAIVTNQIVKSEHQSTVEFYNAINDSKYYLASLNENIVKTLFYFYFKDKTLFPEEIDNKYLNKWFNTKTFLGMYMFPREPISY